MNNMFSPEDILNFVKAIVAGALGAIGALLHIKNSRCIDSRCKAVAYIAGGTTSFFVGVATFWLTVWMFGQPDKVGFAVSFFFGLFGLSSWLAGDAVHKLAIDLITSKVKSNIEKEDKDVKS